MRWIWAEQWVSDDSDMGRWYDTSVKINGRHTYIHIKTDTSYLLYKGVCFTFIQIKAHTYTYIQRRTISKIYHYYYQPNWPAASRTFIKFQMFQQTWDITRGSGLLFRRVLLSNSRVFPIVFYFNPQFYYPGQLHWRGQAVVHWRHGRSIT